MSSRAWPRWCRRECAILSEVPALVDFFFVDDPPMDPDSWQKAIARDEVASSILRGRAGRLRHLRVDARRVA